MLQHFKRLDIIAVHCLLLVYANDCSVLTECGQRSLTTSHSIARVKADRLAETANHLHPPQHLLAVQRQYKHDSKMMQINANQSLK